MAEVVDYRVEKTIDELNLLVEFGLFKKQHAKDILAQREKFEYTLRRRNRTKLDYLKYIKFEWNLLESIDAYRKTVTKNLHKAKKSSNKEEELERRILILQTKKLNDIIRSRSAHISSLFRRLTTSFQFDKDLWETYIDFAKSRKWNTRVSALYWRLLRVAAQDPKIWIRAASHEVDVNRAYDTARGLYLRSLRHHPQSVDIWFEYFKLEVNFMDMMDQRARIVFKTLKALKDDESDGKDGATEAGWDEDPNGENLGFEEDVEDEKADAQAEDHLKDDEKRPEAIKPIEESDEIISGHLPKVVYKNASKAFKNPADLQKFIVLIMSYLLSADIKANGLDKLKEYISTDLKSTDDIAQRKLGENCCDKEYLSQLGSELSSSHSPTKKLKPSSVSKTKLDLLYECYESKGIEETRILYQKFDSSVRDQTLSLYVGMIQVETWQLVKDQSKDQLDRIRNVFERALWKFGKKKPKLWYEYLQFEHKYLKDLKDIETMNAIYLRGQATLEPKKAQLLIEKYNQFQVNNEVEYSDYSDLDD